MEDKTNLINPPELAAQSQSAQFDKQGQRLPDSRKVKITRTDDPASFITALTIERGERFEHWHPDATANEFEVDAVTAAKATACLNCNQSPAVHVDGACPDGRISRYGFVESVDSKTKLKASKTPKADKPEQES